MITMPRVHIQRKLTKDEVMEALKDYLLNKVLPLYGENATSDEKFSLRIGFDKEEHSDKYLNPRFELQIGADVCPTEGANGK